MAEDLTIIIVALLGGDATEQCLEAVRGQSANILVVRRDGSIVDRSGNPIEGPGAQGVPAKRRRAVELACTPFVGLLEDTVVPGGCWADALVRSLGGSTVGCGGPVQIGEALPASTRALAMSEYGTFGKGGIAADMPALPGCNFGFQRDALLRAMEGSEGLVDLDVFRALKEAGGRMAWSSDMAVTFAHPFPEGARLKTRFDHGRLYASGGRRRMSSAVKAPLLPFVLTARALAGSGGEHGISTIGWLLLQHTAWAAGEFVGAVFGPPREGYAQWQ